MSRFASFHRRLPAVRHHVAAACAALLLALALAPESEGASYRVYVCKAPDGSPVLLDKQWVSGWSRAFSSAPDGCPYRAPIALYMASDGHEMLPGGDAAWWTFWFGSVQSTYATDPSEQREGLELEGVTMRRTVTTTPGNDYSASPEYRASITSDGNSRAIEACAAVWHCQLGDPRLGDDPANEIYWQLPKLTDRFEFVVHCGTAGGRCEPGRGTPRVLAQIHRLAFDVNDPAAPAVTSVPTGTMLEHGDHSGVRSLSFATRDTGSGLAEVVVRVDGKVERELRPDAGNPTCSDAGFHSKPDYRAFRPCSQNTFNVQTALDTTKYADGLHRVTVYSYDASGNGREVLNREMTFENVPPPSVQRRPAIVGQIEEPRPGDTLKAEPGVWSGAGITYTYRWQASAEGAAWGDVSDGTKATYVVNRADIGKRLRVVVTAANAEGATQAPTEPTGLVKSGATSVPAGSATPTPSPEGGDPSTAQLVVDREQRTVEVKHGAKIVITGRLVDAANQPIPNATVDVFEQLVLTAAPWNKIGSVTTDSQGGYVFRPKTTASRRLRFAFSDSREVANYRATREVLVSVQAGMTISTKRKVVDPGGRIKIRGRLTVDALPKTGTWVEVQVLDAGVWRTVATRRTSSKGGWTFKHRLRLSRGVSFKFRARLRVVGDVASAESTSPTIKVRVR